MRNRESRWNFRSSGTATVPQQQVKSARDWTSPHGRLISIRQGSFDPAGKHAATNRKVLGWAPDTLEDTRARHLLMWSACDAIDNPGLWPSRDWTPPTSLKPAARDAIRSEVAAVGLTLAPAMSIPADPDHAHLSGCWPPRASLLRKPFSAALNSSAVSHIAPCPPGIDTHWAFGMPMKSRRDCAGGMRMSSVAASTSVGWVISGRRPDGSG